MVRNLTNSCSLGRKYPRIMKHRIRNCPICEGSPKIIWQFKDAPLEDDLQATSDAAKNLVRFPLSLSQCQECQHLFVREVSNPEDSYQNYIFESGSSPGLSETMTSLVRRIWAEADFHRGNKVLDIGSNDGTLLAKFQDFGASVVGIEPSPHHAQIANERGIPTICAYFDSASVSKLRTPDDVGFKVIAIHNVLANLENPREMLRLAAELLASDGVLSLVTGYHPDQFQAGMFDWVYHEHLSYFTATDIAQLASSLGMEVISCVRLPYKGGSLSVLLRKSSRSFVKHSSSFEALVAWERWTDIASAEFVLSLRTRVLEAQSQFEKEFHASQKFIGYGCSHSTTTFIFNFGLEERLAWLVDDNSRRHGYFTPSLGLEVRATQTILEANLPILVLAWQHDWRIYGKLSDLGFSGTVVTLLPRFKILEFPDQFQPTELPPDRRTSAKE